MIGRPAERVSRFLITGTLWLLVFAAAAHAADALPPRPLTLFDGGTLELRSLAGRVVVIRFAASW